MEVGKTRKMEKVTHTNSAAINEIDNAMSILAQIFPELLEKLGVEFEIITGKRLRPHPLGLDLTKIERKLRDLALVVEQFKELSDEVLTPKSAQKTLQLFNRMIRLSVPRIPRNKEPIEYLVQQVKRQAEIPSSLVLPKGLDYNIKHLQLQNFISELISSVDNSQIDAFLQATFTERQLVTQSQRIFGKPLLPKELSRIPSKISPRTVEGLKLALRDVTANWETLINLVYGFYLLKQGQQPTWASIRREHLRNKVTALCQDYRLTPLMKQEWVTVRNSLDHGSAFFNPHKESIEFPNRTRGISWSISTAYFEGIDIFLAYSAMLRVFNFINAAKIEVFDRQIESIRKFASQGR